MKPVKVSEKETEIDSDAEEEEENINSSDDDEHEDEHVEIVAQKDYHSLTPKELILELESLLKSKPIQSLKHDLDEITSEFNAQFQNELEHKKEEFLAEGGNILIFIIQHQIRRHSIHFTLIIKKSATNTIKTSRRIYKQTSTGAMS